MRVGHDFDFLRYVVEDQQGLGQEKSELRKFQVVFSSSGKILKRLDDVIAEIPHGATDKARQFRHRHGAIGVKDLPQTVQRSTPTGDTAHTARFFDA